MSKFGKSSMRLYLWLIAIAILLGGVGLFLGVGGTDSQPPAAKMLPDLPSYDTIEDQQLTEYIKNLSGGAALLLGHPELAATVAVIDQVVGCYQEVGAVRMRAYANQEFPLSAGAVAIADRNALLDPVNLFRCVAPVIPDASAERPEIQPCTARYTLSRDDNEFYIVYVGTTEAICRDFCTALEGCTAH